MKQLNILFKGIIILLCGFTLSLNAQANPEPKNQMLAVNSIDKLDIPGSLCSSSVSNSGKDNSETNTISTGKAISTNLESMLLVQIENEIAIEEWMTSLSYWEDFSQNEIKK